MKAKRILYIFMILILGMGLVSSTAGASSNQDKPLNQPAQGGTPPVAYQLGTSVPTTADQAMEKIDPELRETARAGGDELVKITVLVKPGTDLSRFFIKKVVLKSSELDRVIGLAPAKNLIKVATKRGTLAILTMEEKAAPDVKRVEEMVDEETPTPERQTFSIADAKPVRMDRGAITASRVEPEEIQAPESFYTMDTNGVRATWAMGITGDGAAEDPLKIAVIDSGIDFANPDLFGKQARITDPTSPYFGLPIAFDDRSMSDYALDLQDYRGNWGWYMNAFLEIQDPDLESVEPFEFTVLHPDYGTVVTYTIGSDYQSWNVNGGKYRFGWHPDDTLAYQLGETPGVLVTGEVGSSWGDFDTIYVDILADYVFDWDTSYDAWATLGYETACVNLGWSVYPHCDLSGGMFYFIANGEEPIPASDWLYDLQPPEAGSVVAFMINDLIESGGDHGMLCAGTAIGQGVIEKMPYGGDYGSMYWPPIWYDPAIYGGISQGPAKNAGLVAMGNFYQGGSSLNFYDFTALGYDGIPAGDPEDHFDQPHMSSNSYGAGAVENDGWNLYSRYVAAINRGYVLQQEIELPEGGEFSPVFVSSSGNSGFGYGTVTSPNPETAVMVGVSTVFGQFNLGDTAIYPDWVNWGDLGGFSDRGPTASSTQGVHVLANGFFGSGNIPLNYLVGGDWAVDYWSGTSRSSPEVMGILALIYDAYYEQNGYYPSWSEARSLLMNGARPAYSDPLAQGAGLANAFNAVQIVKGSGVNITTSEGDGYWYPGNYRGVEYPGFARGLYPSETDYEVFSMSRADAGLDSPTPFSVDLEAITLKMIDSRQFQYMTRPYNAEGPGTRYYDRRLFGDPGSNKGFRYEDPIYLTTDPEDVTLLQEADLMVVRLTYPFEQFNDDIYSNWWFLYAWAWRDNDLDGSWYNDINGNLVRNSGEFPAVSEMVRINYDYHGNTAEIRIREPWLRLNGITQPGEPLLAPMNDIIISARHFNATEVISTTNLVYTVELYKEEPWDEVRLGTSSVFLEPGSSVSFDATVVTEEDSNFGVHSGYIKASYTPVLDNFVLPFTEYVPVFFQVWFPARVDPKLGDVDESTLYDNGVMFGGTGPSSSGQRAESGDWRFFFTDVFAESLPDDMASYFLARASWVGEGDAPTDTDIDTLFYGQVTDDFSMNWPEIFGPYSMQVIGGSMRSGSPPDWNYYTSTGGPVDWNSTKIDKEGLYTVAGQTVRWGGEQTTVPFTISVGTVQATSPIVVKAADCTGCEVPIEFKTNHRALDGKELQATTYGFNQIVDEMLTVVHADYTYYFYDLIALDALKLQINTYLAETNVDADLTVYYYNGSDWIEVGYSGRSDSNEQVLLTNPAPGPYAIEIYGYNIPGGTKDIQLTIQEVSGKDVVMSVSDLPASIIPGKPYTLTLTFDSWPSEPGHYLGVVFLGPPESPLAVEIPVFVTDLWETFLPLIFNNVITP